MFSLKTINKQAGIRASRVEFSFKFNKRACSFIRYFRVPSTHLMTFIKLNTILNMSFSWKMSEKISNDRRTVTQSFFSFLSCTCRNLCNYITFTCTKSTFVKHFCECISCTLNYLCWKQFYSNQTFSQKRKSLFFQKVQESLKILTHYANCLTIKRTYFTCTLKPW